MDKQEVIGRIRHGLIRDIMARVDLPLIGIIKKNYPGCEAYITPTMDEVDQLVAAGCTIIALDCTRQSHPGGLTSRELVRQARAKYPRQLFMADCATLEEARRAQALGFDLVGTTLCGYTQDTLGTPIPSLPLLEAMTRELSVPVIAEGGIWEREQLRQVFAYPVHAAVIGTAITRPREITRRFVEAAGAQEGQYGA